MSPVINLDGTHTIQNMAWEARYADLSDNQANGLIIGFEFNNRSNQKWTFQHIGDTGDSYRISSLGNQNVFIQDTGASYELQGGPDGTIFTIEFVPGVLQPTGSPNGYYTVRISSPDPVLPQQVVYWTLNSGAGGKPIALAQLLPAPGYQQVWKLYQL